MNKERISSIVDYKGKEKVLKLQVRGVTFSRIVSRLRCAAH